MENVHFSQFRGGGGGYHLKCFKIIGIIKSNNENIINCRSPKTPINNINKLAIKPTNKNV